MCRACRAAGKCVDEPTPETAWILEDGTEVDRCPAKMVPAEVFDLIELADMTSDAGELPITGGILEQTEAFLQGWGIYRAELNHWKAEATSGREET